MQTNNKKAVREYLLHLWSDGSWGFESTHGAFMGEGQSWFVSKVRLEGTEDPVLQLQYKSGRKRGRLLRKNVKGNRAAGNI